MANSVIANAAMHAASRVVLIASRVAPYLQQCQQIRFSGIFLAATGLAKPFGGSRREIRELLCCRGRSLSFFDRSRIVEIHSPES